MSSFDFLYMFFQFHYGCVFVEESFLLFLQLAPITVQLYSLRL